MLRTDVLVSSPVYLVGLVHVLTEAGFRVVAARTSPQEEPSWLADAVLIDADAVAPLGDLRHVTETATCTAVLVLHNGSMPSAEEYLRAGATGVVSKRDSGERIISAVRAVAAGACVVPAEYTAVVHEPRPETSAYHLSKREEQVLCQIARGLTHGQIATRLGISPHTVDTYVKRIRSKLGVGNKAELTRAALLGRLTTESPRSRPGR